MVGLGQKQGNQFGSHDKNNNNGLNQEGSRGVGKKLDSVFILKVKPTEFASGLNVGHRGKTGFKDDCKTSGLRSWKDRVAVT